MAVILSLSVLIIRHGSAVTISDEEALARKFSPILILTKDEKASGRRVLRPEPVKIVGAQSAANLRFEVTGKKGSGVAPIPKRRPLRLYHTALLILQ